MIDYKSLNDDDLIKIIKDKISARAEWFMNAKESIDYYNDEHDILNKKRYAIGKDGKLSSITNLPNNIIIDNKYASIVDQKLNYQFGKPPNVRQSENASYEEDFQNFMDSRFLRTLNKVAFEAIVTGLGFMYVYLDESGEGLKYKKVDTLAITPIWQDNSCEKLEAIIYQYSEDEFVDGKVKKVKYLAFFTDDLVKTFKMEGDSYTRVKESPYIVKGGKGLTYGKIPFIYFKYNDMRPLLQRVKSLQDAINTILSLYTDNLMEDPRSTILILHNYDGENLGEFRENLARYGAVKVRSDDGAKGGVDTLQVTVNSENYKMILELLKEKLYENGKGLNTKNQKMSGNPNQLDIKSMYADIETDASKIDVEFKASFEYLEYFFRKVKGVGDKMPLSDITFKRTMLTNEESTVSMIMQSVGLVSKKTLLSKHPLVDDVAGELDELEKEKEEVLDMYGDFGKHVHSGGLDE